MKSCVHDRDLVAEPMIAQPGDRFPARPGRSASPNRMLPVVRASPRRGLVARVRAEIAAGTYDIDARLDQALDRLFEDLACRLA